MYSVAVRVLIGILTRVCGGNSERSRSRYGVSIVPIRNELTTNELPQLRRTSHVPLVERGADGLSFLPLDSGARRLDADERRKGRGFAARPFADSTADHRHLQQQEIRRHRAHHLRI